MSLKTKVITAYDNVCNFFKGLTKIFVSEDEQETYGITPNVISIQVTKSGGYTVRDVVKAVDVEGGVIVITAIEVYANYKDPSVSVSTAFLPDHALWYSHEGKIEIVTKKTFDTRKKELEKKTLDKPVKKAVKKDATVKPKKTK